MSDGIWAEVSDALMQGDDRRLTLFQCSDMKRVGNSAREMPTEPTRYREVVLTSHHRSSASKI
jgi:hypothetical protein